MSIIELQDESFLNKKQFKFVFFSTLNQTHIYGKKSVIDHLIYLHFLMYVPVDLSNL